MSRYECPLCRANHSSPECPTIQGDAGVACPCGGRMLYKRPSDPASPVACPRCGRTPLDLVKRRDDE
jgi:DNA-directed RNA polymerase subunit RPC12/RpoP